MDLHWLRVPERVKFKMCVLMHRCLTGAAPAAIFDRAGSACRQYCSSSPALGVISVAVRSLLPVHERGTAYHLTFEHLQSTPSFDTFKKHLKSNPTSFNSSLACRACDYVYIDYVRRSRSSSCRLLRPINCQTYITLLYFSKDTYDNVRASTSRNRILSETPHPLASSWPHLRCDVGLEGGEYK